MPYTWIIRNGRQAGYEPLPAAERIDCDTGDCDDPCPHLARWETLEVWPEDQERLLLCAACFATWLLCGVAGCRGDHGKETE